jgi:peptidoglycan/LPS O-acetylase OafA/YrhL
MQKEPIRNLNLDMLRFFSALLVVAYHFGFRMAVTGDGGETGFSEFSHTAIWLDCGFLIFFSISGYVITLSAEGRSAMEFAIGRFARLWPTFVVCATITAVILYNWPIESVPVPTLKQWAAHFVINSRALGQPFLDGAYWTIVYEIVFYGWVFIMIALGWFEHHWKRILCLWLAVSVANEFALDSNLIRKLLITEYSGYFAFGVAIYKFETQNTKMAALIVFATVVWAALSQLLTADQFFAQYGVNRNTLGLLLVGPICCAVVAICAFGQTLPLKASIATTLGALTYPLYLLHQNIGYAAFTHYGESHGRWLVGTLLIATLLLTAWILARWFEPPLRVHIRVHAGEMLKKLKSKKI